MKEAIAIGFELEMERLSQPDCYFHSLALELLPKRDYMAKFLREVGMVPTIPEGGYFMLANWSALENKVNLHEETDENKDYKFTKWMTKNVGLQGIPPSAFYSPEHKHLAEDYVRYCFIKVSHAIIKMNAITLIKTFTHLLNINTCILTERRKFEGGR